MAMLLSGGFAWSQNRNVTFQVDMTGQTVSANGVHIAGDFQSAAGAPGNWDPAATALTQVGTTNIYEVQVSIPDGIYQFKFIFKPLKLRRKVEVDIREVVLNHL